jgi:CheY-like chemotaxis protein
MTKILLVEDDKSLREIYGVRLLAEGYDIVSAGDGEEALAMAIKERPQLIVSDVMMPKISGFDMLDILRSTTETRDIRVIMMTALSSEDQRLRGEQLGADRYLVKSQVGIEDVVRTVHEVLEDTPTAPIQQVEAPLPQQPVAAFQPQQPTEPVAPQTPAPQPVSPTPVQPQQIATPEQDSSFPQPTAPFSSPRPATLGERIIQPIENPSNDQANIADRIAAELNQQAPAAPQTPQVESQQPQTQPPRGAQPYTPESN